jgi:hypothetical protein
VFVSGNLFFKHKTFLLHYGCLEQYKAGVFFRQSSKPNKLERFFRANIVKNVFAINALEKIG